MSAIGLQSQQRALDVIASNIANVNTPGFKRSEVRFSDVLALSDDPDVPRADMGDPPLAGDGVLVDAVPMINEPGAIQSTGHPMDIAINGQGFVELMGADGQTILWRGGTLKVGDDGLLSTSAGLALKAAITVPDDATGITIGSDGVVTAQTSGSTASTQIGQINLVRVDDPTTLERLDGGLYRVGDGARVTDAQPGEDGAGTLEQGALEQSNVEMTNEMVQLMLVQRSFGANAEVVQAADQLMAIANGLRSNT